MADAPPTISGSHDAVCDSALVEEVRQRYGVGPHYAAAYLEYWSSTRSVQPGSIEEILASPPPEPMWFDFAMSTNYRGRELRDFLKPHIPAGAKRYFDVGCGFGGYLAAFAEAGMDVCGVEIDPIRVELSRANCRDHGLADCVFDMSILEEGLPERLGRFDVISCGDVIEHVLDVEGALRNIAELLAPGGILQRILDGLEPGPRQLRLLGIHRPACAIKQLVQAVLRGHYRGTARSAALQQGEDAQASLGQGGIDGVQDGQRAGPHAGPFLDVQRSKGDHAGLPDQPLYGP